jgi:hypothetical protein
MTGAYAAFLLTSVLLTAVTLYHSHSGHSTEDGSTSLDGIIGTVHRKVWHDSLNPRSPRDRDLPSNLRGDASERVHYMESIIPTEDTAWWSACIASPEVIAEVEEESVTIIENEVNHAIRAHERTGARRMELQREGADAKAQASHRATLRQDGETNGMVNGGIQFHRDDKSRHHYAPPSAHPAGGHTPWTNPRNPFGFKRRPRRNPTLACMYSTKYREEHADVCSSLPATMPPVLPLRTPFKRVSFVLKAGKDTSCAAWGWFSNDLLLSGWNYLYVESNPTLDDEAQARAAGYLEGALTVQPIFEHHTNEFEVLFPPAGAIDDLTKGFLTDMTTFNLQMVASSAATDPYWQQLGLLYQQLQGMYEGYMDMNLDPSKSISFFDFTALQYDGDMADIQATVGAVARVTPTDSLQTIMEYLIRNGHCSALIKLTGQNEELFAAHDTWAGFASTHRMFKAYRLPFANVSATLVHFSSYPSFLASTDDWYQTSVHGHTRQARLALTSVFRPSTIGFVA